MLFLERESNKKNFHALLNPLLIPDFCPVTAARFSSGEQRQC